MLIRVFDRFLLFLSSAATILISAAGCAYFAGWPDNGRIAMRVFQSAATAKGWLAVLFGLWFLIGLRFLAVSLYRSKAQAPSIDQKTDFGDIRISLTTVENLALKAAGRVRGAKDLKAKISVAETGLTIALRTVVDGDSEIPAMTEDMQRVVKQHVESTTGIPVASVTVYVANIIQAHSAKSRVE